MQTVINKFKVNWLTATVMLLFHVGAVAALFTFSWKAFIVSAFLYWLTIGCGIGMGYHRLLTHRSYTVPKWFEYFLAICGTMTLEGGPIFWGGDAPPAPPELDKEGDPHSPRDGGFWSHMGWIIFGEAKHNDTRNMARYTPDLSKDAFYRWLNTYHFVPLTLTGIALAFYGGLPMVLWGVFLRVVVGLHATWLVNSASHMWGPKRFDTRDDSRNNWWVALLTFGEGWHNNHHAFPNSSRHGLAWYELDVTWLQIAALKLLHFANGVKVVDLKTVQSEKRAA